MFVYIVYQSLTFVHISGRNFGDDSGEWLAEARDAGFLVYPGMPNGTEIGQEMDQLFGPLKKVAYGNRDELSKAIVRTEGPHATISLTYIGYILFGGRVLLKNGESLVLANAFDRGLDRDLVKRARLKCGYCPAT